MELLEKTLESQIIFQGVIVTVRKDKAELINGQVVGREVVEHPGGVGILALEEDGSVLLVRQYRYAVGEHLWEIPAGKREAGEAPFVTA